MNQQTESGTVNCDGYHLPEVGPEPTDAQQISRTAALDLQVGAEGGMYVDRLDEFWNKQSYKLEVLGGVTNRGAVLRKLYERYLEGFERMIVSQGLK